MYNHIVSLFDYTLYFPKNKTKRLKLIEREINPEKVYSSHKKLKQRPLSLALKSQHLVNRN